MPWSTDVRMNGGPKSQCHSAVEMMQFKRDQTLIVIHANHRVVIAARRMMKQTIRRKRSMKHGMPLRFAALTAGAMISISSAPKMPFSPPWGLSAATAIRGRAMPKNFFKLRWVNSKVV